MEGKQKLAVGILVLAALSAFLPMPTGDGVKPPPFIIALTMVLGVLGLVAAFGVFKGQRWGKVLGITVRSIDVLSALPAFGAGVAPGLLAYIAIGIVLSIVCIVALVRWQPAGAPVRA